MKETEITRMKNFDNDDYNEERKISFLPYVIVIQQIFFLNYYA